MTGTLNRSPGANITPPPREDTTAHTRAALRK